MELGAKEKSKLVARPPKFEITDVEDAYAFYVLVLGMSEDIFFNADIPFLLSVMANKNAYDLWQSSVENKLREEAKK